MEEHGKTAVFSQIADKFYILKSYIENCKFGAKVITYAKLTAEDILMKGCVSEKVYEYILKALEEITLFDIS